VKRFAPLLVLLLAPAVVRADAASPGTHSIPADVVIEVDREYPEFVFVMKTDRRVEVLKIAPGRPAHMSPDWEASPSRGQLYIIPAREFDGGHEAPALREWLKRHEYSDKLRSWERVDFYASVWFYDTRGRVVNTYRLEGGDGRPHLRLIHQTPDSDGGKLTRYVVAAFLTVGAVLSVRWFRRRARAASAAS
jgi:hypothetical protein